MKLYSVFICLAGHSAPSLQPLESSFGASYNIHDDFYDDTEQQVLQQSSEMVLASELSVSPYPFANENGEAALVMHYMQNVMRIQYLLADPASIDRFIFGFAQTSASARSAMCLLSAVHQHSMRQIMYPRAASSNTEEMDLFYKQTRNLLRGAETYTEGDAMAGLHVVSSFLFTGGHGPWNYFLQVAMHWVELVLGDERYGGPREAFRHCEESAKFIIRTTMWFDVWSAVTRRTEPRFRLHYRELFEGEHGYADGRMGDIDMLPVMGCTNETVLAMSETAALAFWKDYHIRAGASRRERVRVLRVLTRGCRGSEHAAADRPGTAGGCGGGVWRADGGLTGLADREPVPVARARRAGGARRGGRPGGAAAAGGERVPGVGAGVPAQRAVGVPAARGGDRAGGGGDGGVPEAGADERGGVAERRAERRVSGLDFGASARG